MQEAIMNNDIKVLVVDDDPDVLFATSRIVKKEGFQVFTASDGRECLESAGKNKPDLILLDVMLPDANGIDLCGKIKKDPELGSAFVVLISGSKTESDEQAEGLDAGADGYIARPISNRELRSRIHSMVRILSAERERDRLIGELQEALSAIRQLQGLLPICSSCKKIRDDKGYWVKLENYISDHSEATFTHGLCQECADKYLSDSQD